MYRIYRHISYIYIYMDHISYKYIYIDPADRILIQFQFEFWCLYTEHFIYSFYSIGWFCIEHVSPQFLKGFRATKNPLIRCTSQAMKQAGAEWMSLAKLAYPSAAMRMLESSGFSGIVTTSALLPLAKVEVGTTKLWLAKLTIFG